MPSLKSKIVIKNPHFSESFRGIMITKENTKNTPYITKQPELEIYTVCVFVFGFTFYFFASLLFTFTAK
jgi:hypothetical protein